MDACYRINSGMFSTGNNVGGNDDDEEGYLACVYSASFCFTQRFCFSIIFNYNVFFFSFSAHRREISFKL